MNRILELRQSRTAALDGANAILAKLETEKRTAMSPEEKVAFEGFKATAQGIDETIAATEALEQIRGNAHTDGPAGRQLDVHNNEEDKPWGPMARSNESKEERRKRVALGFGEYLTAVKNGSLAQISGRAVDPRLMALNDGFQKRAAAAGSSEAVPSDGGFLVYPDFANEILMLAHDTGLVFPMTRKLPLSEFTNAIKIPAVDEQSRKDGYRWGGVQMFWENEAQQLVGSKPTIALLEMVTKKLTGLYYATNEVLADSRLLGAVVLQAFSEEMGFKLDDGVIRGTGAGQLSGILSANALITVAKESGQAAATIVPANIQKMWGRMWNRSRRNAVWLINQDIEQQLNGLNSQGVGSSTNTSGIPIYLPPGAGTFGPFAGAPLVGGETGYGNAGMLYGRPVFSIEQCASLGNAGDIMLVDLTQYLMIDKGDMQTASSMHVRFLSDEMTYRWIYRCDGQPWWKVAISPAQGSNTLSPFVVLAAR